MLTIAQRRALSARAMTDPAFRDHLIADPVAAVKDGVGVTLPDSEAVTVVEEAATRWSFVVPDAGKIEADLPEPTDARASIENDIYAALRDEPEVIETAARDPKSFLADRFGLNIGAVDLRRETPHSTVLVVPYNGVREELSDDMLDLVAGGQGGDDKGGNPFFAPTPPPPPSSKV